MSKEPAERARRGLQAERTGLDSGVVGTKGRIRRLSERTRIARLLERFADHREKDGVPISIAGPPISGAGQASFGVVLELSPRAMAKASTRRAVSALPEVVRAP